MSDSPDGSQPESKTPTPTPAAEKPPEALRAFAQRAEETMRAQRFDDALALTETELASRVVEGVSVAQLIERLAAGEAIEGLVRREGDGPAVPDLVRESLMLRWEVLRRSQRAEQARTLRAICERCFPQHPPVWLTAGTHALEARELDEAERCFDRALSLAPKWSLAISAKALVLEAKKDFQAALPLRHAAMMAERALEKNDAASVQRVLRFAFALGRVGRWAEAEPLFRRCVALGAAKLLPHERPILFHVFTIDLYAPAMLVAVLSQCGKEPQTLPREAELVVRQVQTLGRIYQKVSSDASLDAGTRGLARGLVAWLAGDCGQSYQQLDEAESELEGDLTVQLLLLASAQALRAAELPSIGNFARQAAMAVIERAKASTEPVGEAEPLLQALLVLERLGEAELARATLAELQERNAAALAPYRTALEKAGEPLEKLAPMQGELLEVLRALTLLGLAQRAAGRSARAVGEAIDAALEALAPAPATPSGPAAPPPTAMA